MSGPGGPLSGGPGHAAAGERVELDLSGLQVRLDGLPPPLARRLRAAWRPFVAARGSGGPGPPWLVLEVGRPLEHGIDPREPYRPKAMQAWLGPGGARFAMPEGEAAIGASGPAAVRLAPDPPERRDYFTLLNLLRACLAWRLPDRGGAMLHAAGLVVGGQAFVLVGGEGSGKSTWARQGELAGARVISDDVVLLDGAGERVEVLGSPLHSTHSADYGPGRWPLAALLFPRHGSPPQCSRAPRVLARARLASNLPFLVEALESDPRPAQVLERLVGEVPCADLRFAVDPGFAVLLERWAASERAPFD